MFISSGTNSVKVVAVQYNKHIHNYKQIYSSTLHGETTAVLEEMTANKALRILIRPNRAVHLLP